MPTACGNALCPVQLENEYGFVPWAAQNRGYIRHLADRAYHHLGRDVTLFTTDPPGNAAVGGLPLSDIYTCGPRQS